MWFLKSPNLVSFTLSLLFSERSWEFKKNHYINSDKTTYNFLINWLKIKLEFANKISISKIYYTCIFKNKWC